MKDQIYHLALPPATLMIDLDHLWVIIETASEITENASGIKSENAPETAPSIKLETASGIKLDHAPALYPAHRMQEGL